MVVPQGGGERELTGKYTKQQISASQGGLEMHCNGLEMDSKCIGNASLKMARQCVDNSSECVF